MQSELIFKTATTSLLAYLLLKIISWLDARRTFESPMFPSKNLMNTSTNLPLSQSAVAVRKQAHDSAPIQNNSFTFFSSLDDGVCVVVMAFLDHQDLCLGVGNVSHRFRDLGSSDLLWRSLCQLRWAEKQNMPKVDFAGNMPLFWRADYTGLELTTWEQSMLKMCEQHLTAIGGVKLPLLRVLPRMLGKWKTAFAYAEIDKRRQLLQLDEVSYFRWQLVYNNAHSTTGLRHFQEGGVYASPYLGVSSWRLKGDGARFDLGGMELSVQRRNDDWGWVIGGRTMTEYLSVEFSSTSS
jgi:hypothetical protein